MSPRLRIAFTLFLFSLIAMVGGLWHPLLSWSLDQKTLEDLEMTYHKKRFALEQIQDQEQKKQSLWKLKKVLQQKGFLSPYDEKAMRILLSRLCKKYHVNLQGPHFSESILEQSKFPQGVSLIFTPLSFTLVGPSEEKLYSFFKAFMNQSQGILITKKLTLFPTKKYEFKMGYDGWIVKGQMSSSL